ncbi:MAG TPA: Hpt domain-containing protein, partial [Rhodocyclaceae bacterium]|nr:Hpt domain-containing protein [Rhodocyclaceae bacterium]
EKQFFNQLAREILINLGQIEQTLDAFFRNPAQRETLSSLSSPIKQIEGAFAMLGEQAAVQLMRDSAAQVTRFAESETPPEQAECDEVAHKLSALGFYVDALKTGPAKLEHFLDPESAKADEAQVAAVSGTVEAQLVRETRETHSLMEAFNEAPQDAALRNQLVSNLEAIREDAQLVADAQLEQHAKEAIASLKAGDATSAQLQEALAITAPAAAPQPSAEAARLMSVSSEELDAELLGIFLEEAKEVLDTIAEFRNKAAATPNDHDALTTVRRGFHTLKGSSRMVGLNDFSEPARHVEMTMNRWLQLEKDADAELVALIDEAHSAFTAWVVQLDAGGSVWRDASALIQHAERVLAGLDPAPDDVAPLPGGPPPKERPLGKFARPAEPSQSVKLEPGEPVSSGLDFDFDVDLPELASERGASNQTHEAALEETHFDMPSLESLGLDEAALPETDDDPELDLTSTQMSGDLLSSIGSEDISEIDLSETMIDGIPLFGGMDEPSLDVQRMPGAATRPSSPPVKVEADDEIHVVHKDEDITTTALDFELPSDDETDTEPLSLGVEPLPTFQETGLDGIRLESGDESITTTALDFELPNEGPDHPEPSALNVDPVASPEAFLNTPFTTYSAPGSSTETAGPVEAPAATAANIPTSSPARSDDGLEEVSIDDDDFDIELPRINMKVLGSAEPSPAEEDPPEPEPAAPNDTEVVIGDHTLSRGLYELYMNEARQHLSTLHDEQERLEGNPLRIPSMESIRAAHTLAGISGTARIDPAHTLGKALEHAQNRFHEVSRAPDPYQVALMGAALRTLEDMVSAIARLQMPLEVPELIDQLVELKPVFDSAPLPPVVDVPDLDASTTTMAYDTAELPTEAGDEPATALPTPASEVANAQEVYDEPVAAEPEVSTVQDELDEQLLPIFFEEADELTEEMSGTLRQLRTEPTDSGAQQALARVLHTLKGSARMAGAMRLGEYVHALESRMEHMQAGSTMVDEMENGLDHIGTMLEALRNPAAETPAVVEEAADHDVAMAEDGVVPPSSSVQTRPTAQIVEPVETPEAPQQQERRSTLRVRADVVDRFVNEAGEISIARTRVEGEMRTLRRSLLDLTENVIRLRNQLREIEIQAESQMQSRIAAAESQHANFDPLEFDRFTRLQEVTRMMAESVGDVTTIQQNLLRNLDSADFALHAQGRLSRDLQQALMTVRMVPFEETVDRLYRVVRQTAKELGKRANLDVRNGSIEIDRGVLDKMVAPLEHLLRNAIAHGIEMPEERTAAGKPEFGQITLTLHQLSNEIALDLSDDGRGLNYERILARGRKVGLVGADETPTENRLTQLIFEPGFSTAETVSGIAGRGVGMDVVKNEALAVGGRIDVSSTPGQGARFLIHLPLTLAVTQALLVRASGRTYAIPSNMVEQALELKETPLQNVRSQGFVEWKDQQYPFRYLPRLLGDTVTQPVPGRYHWVLLLRAGNQTLAMHIDELRGNQEVIVKNAGPQFVRLQGFTGATVLPDGEIALIINPVILAGRTAAQIEADELQPQAVAEVAHVPLIMVVDDSLTVRKITSRLLEREGYRVVTAKDGVDALEQLGEVMPDVVLTDIEMPRMDGFDLARNIRADERLGRLPLIMITSRMADKHREYAREIGVNHYLGKPFQEDILLELIQSFVQK